MSNHLRKRSYSKLMELKLVLDRINDQVETTGYIQDDPVQFMHAFETKKDREIAGFIAALMAWGRRDIVIRKTAELLERMDNRPFEYVMAYTPGRSDDFIGFKHRTFKQVDIHEILSALQKVYLTHADFEEFWLKCYRESKENNRNFVSDFHHKFLFITNELAGRTHKHISDPGNNSPGKRLYMFLRWAVRKNSPVDTGIWSFISPSELMIPLDVHVARQSRRLGLLSRRSNDWKAVKELTDTFRLLDPDDPVRYDYALFGLGALGYSVPDRFLLNSV
jgi:uncharacterized protein (TIGR02757 family)